MLVLNYGNASCPIKDFFASDYQSKVTASNMVKYFL